MGITRVARLLARWDGNPWSMSRSRGCETLRGCMGMVMSRGSGAPFPMRSFGRGLGGDSSSLMANLTSVYFVSFSLSLIIWARERYWKGGFSFLFFLIVIVSC